MVVDLPLIMVSVARRFHFHAQGEPVPVDLSFLTPRHPLKNPVTQFHYEEKDLLKFLARPDVPLAKHADAIAMYAVLCNNFCWLEYVDEVAGLQDWDETVKTLVNTVKDDMPDATGGLEKAKWWAYVECVVKAVVVWQAYCERVRELSAT
jgi:hypothetical protein